MPSLHAFSAPATVIQITPLDWPGRPHVCWTAKRHLLAIAGMIVRLTLLLPPYLTGRFECPINPAVSFLAPWLPEPH